MQVQIEGALRLRSKLSLLCRHRHPQWAVLQLAHVLQRPYLLITVPGRRSSVSLGRQWLGEAVACYRTAGKEGGGGW